MNFRKKSVIFALLMVILAGQAIAAPLPSREIKLTGRLLLIPVGSRIAPDGERNRANNLRVSVDGLLVHNVGLIIAPTPEEVVFWGYLDMSEYVGRTAKLEVRGPIVDNALALFESSHKERYLKPLYTENGRPQFHFSQKQGWNNDVNGMVYYDGLYHLSWQCNPVGRSWGNMYWGHAVSRDLLHWEEWPRVLRAGGGATKEGTINDNVHRSMAIRQCFSGSACVDIDNTLGKQKGDVKTLIACFTDTGSGLPRGPGEALAYSTDNGRTYTYMKDYNPLISHKGRDPRLFWHGPSKHWVIVVYEQGTVVKEGGKKTIKGGKMGFYTSKDLKDWELTGYSDPLYHECPDFLELPLDGDPNNKRWLLFDATPKYQIGTFDGRKFTAELKETRRTMGGAIKAAQCFSNTKDGRTICMVWARINCGDDAPFSQGFTLPVDLTLKTAVDGPRVYANPIKELDSLHGAELISIKDKKLAAAGETISLTRQAQLLDIQLTLKIEGNPKTVKLNFGRDEVLYDYANKEFPRHNLKVFDKEDGKLDMRIFVDRPTVEVFAEGGSVYYLEGRRVLGESIKDISLVVDGGSATIENLKAYEMKSIWKK